MIVMSTVSMWASSGTGEPVANIAPSPRAMLGCDLAGYECRSRTMFLVGFGISVSCVRYTFTLLIGGVV